MEVTTPGMAAIAMGAAPVLGGVPAIDQRGLVNASLGVLLRCLAVRAQIPDDDALSQGGVPFVGDKGGVSAPTPATVTPNHYHCHASACLAAAFIAPFGRCRSAPVSPYAGPRFHNPYTPSRAFVHSASWIKRTTLGDGTEQNPNP